jgi:hypothetical protein
MSTDAEIIADIESVFSSALKPEHFTNFTHCEECAEHDELLQSKDRDNLHISDVNNPGWDPLSFCSPEGFAYFMPTLVKFALTESEPVFSPYAGQLLFHLFSGAEYNRFYQYCSSAQRASIASLLSHLLQTRSGSLELYADDMFRAHELWSKD